MDNLTWQKGKNLKSFIEHGARGSIDLQQLAVTTILVLAEQKLTIEEFVTYLFQANDFDSKISKRDRETWRKQLGF